MNSPLRTDTETVDHITAVMSDPTVRARLEKRCANKLRANGLNFRICNQEAEVLVSELFQRAWKKRDEYDNSLGSVEQWMFGFLKYLLFEEGRERYKQPRIITDDVDSQPDHFSAEDYAMQADELRAAFDRVEPETRKILEWRYIEGMSFEAIAERIDKTAVNTRQIITRIRKQLRLRLPPAEGQS